MNLIPRLSLLKALPDEASTSLVKAARQYQEAVWTCDADPNLSWLLLVSGVETAANLWRKSREDPVARLRASRPAVLTLLERAGGDALVNEVAKEIAPYMGATKKFCDFLLEHVPEPPTPRPPAWAGIDWTSSALRKALSSVYDLRSKALHSGTPFPPALSRPPRAFDNGAAAEKMAGTAVSEAGGVWIAEDLPMLLSTFHYICRTALLNWWGRLLESPPNDPSA